ncbi:MAG: diguanylate cyclase [Acidobacteria bacterium]|jgi:two-component system chemotaxis response regulator CheY|nr:diguanylate cyclase [Acidobacteriota bacterium]
MRVLVVEDEPVSRRMLSAAISRMGYDVVAAADGREAWDVLRAEQIGLVVTDWMMPEMDGLQLVEKIRGSELGRYVYVILLTSRSESRDAAEALEAGADDFIAKPWHRDELTARLTAGRRILDLQAALQEKNLLLERMTRVDGLTGIGNRRNFDEEFPRAFETARRFHRFLSVAMLDIDRFKAYNDRFGHEAGDIALRAVAAAIDETVRTADQSFRYGGEEFCCTFPETDEAGAGIVADRLRAAVERLGIVHPENCPWGVVTISVGVAALQPSTTVDPEDLLRAADQALYRAKAQGRNRTVALAPERLLAPR